MMVLTRNDDDVDNGDINNDDDVDNVSNDADVDNGVIL